MSYQYARIPLKPGLNVVCGPNGSGKSSILLAISVALGQTYTERSRKLSDLIRWGQDNARITLVFDNTQKDGKRPVTKYEVDYFRISRYLRKDGTYGYEINFQAVNKSELTTILHEFGFDPDNMLNIMHQNTMEEFGLTSSNQKLILFEEAIGLVQHRQNILEAQQKLSHILSEEESIKNMLERSKETLTYWKSEYDRYQRRKQLLSNKSVLEKELLWAQVKKQEILIQSWKKKIELKEQEIIKLQNEVVETKKLLYDYTENVSTFTSDYKKTVYFLLNLEKNKTEDEVVIKIQTETLEKLAHLPEASLIIHSEYFKEYITKINSQLITSEKRLQDVNARLALIQVNLEELEKKVNSTTKSYIDASIREGLVDFRLSILKNELTELNTELTTSQREIDLLKPLSEKSEPRLETSRSSQEISEEIKITNIQLLSLREVSEDVEKMYTNYLQLFNELKEKATIVTENRTMILRELNDRKQTWRNLVQSTLEEITKTYQHFLSRVGANGSLRVINSQDIETAGLELSVGFKGIEPKVLDSYTQSGGERTTATMAFLLALQQFLRSPFRGIDEFDVHMDPRNREVVSEMILKEVSWNKEIQYLAITPGEITSIEKDVNVITVQNLVGKSTVRVIS